jgi:hypothetical protein
VSPSGSHNTGRLLADQSYDLKAVGPGGADSKTISIKVGDWTTSNFGLISHDYWVLDSEGYKTPDMSDFYMYKHNEINPREFDIAHYYKTNGDYLEKKISTGETIGTGNWSLLSDDSLEVSGGKGFIEALTQDNFIIINKIPADSSVGGYAFFKTIYKRNN